MIRQVDLRHTRLSAEPWWRQRDGGFMEKPAHDVLGLQYSGGASTLEQ